MGRARNSGRLDRTTPAAVAPLAAGAFLACVALLLAGLWLWAGTRPETLAEQATRLVYRQQVGMRYSASVTPGAIYGTSEVGPQAKAMAARILWSRRATPARLERSRSA